MVFFLLLLHRSMQKLCFAYWKTTQTNVCMNERMFCKNSFGAHLWNFLTRNWSNVTNVFLLLNRNRMKTQILQIQCIEQDGRQQKAVVYKESAIIYIRHMSSSAGRYYLKHKYVCMRLLIMFDVFLWWRHGHWVLPASWADSMVCAPLTKLKKHGSIKRKRVVRWAIHCNKTHIPLSLSISHSLADGLDVPILCVWHALHTFIEQHLMTSRSIIKSHTYSKSNWWCVCTCTVWVCVCARALKTKTGPIVINYCNICYGKLKPNSGIHRHIKIRT